MLFCSKVLKEISVGDLQPDETVDAMHEAKLLSKLDHPGIVQFHDSFIDGEYFCIVTEFCEVRILLNSFKICLVCLGFYSQFYTIHVISSHSVNLLRLFLWIFRPKRLTNTKWQVHILSPLTYNCHFCISSRGRMSVQIISWSISTKVTWPGWSSNSRSLDLNACSQLPLPTALWSLASFKKINEIVYSRLTDCYICLMSSCFSRVYM